MQLERPSSDCEVPHPKAFGFGMTKSAPRIFQVWRLDPSTSLGMTDNKGNMRSPEEPKGELVIRTIAMPADTNPNGDIFGGWLMSQMDLGSGILASKTAKARVVTVAMEGLSFLQPVGVGDTVACYAWVEKIGRTSMTIPVEVWVERFREQGRQILVTRGVFVYVAVDDAGRPIPVQRDGG